MQEWYNNGVAAYKQGHYQEAKTWLEQCKEAYESQQKQDMITIGVLLNTLGKVIFFLQCITTASATMPRRWS